MKSKNGVILAIISLISGIWLDIPSEASLAEMIVKALMGNINPGSLEYQNAQNVIFALDF